MAPRKKSHSVYQFRINLIGAKPEIWRKIQIKDDSTLGDLHTTIQIVMGWTDYYLNEFIISKKHYTVPNWGGRGSGGGEYAGDVKLKDLPIRLNKRFLYEYDFFVFWKFHITLEKTLEPQAKKTYPTCISGASKSPDEECGGIEKFNDLRTTWAIRNYEMFYDLAKILKQDSQITVGEISKKLGLDKNKREQKYWLHIDKFEKRQINKYLKYYGKNDDRWKEAYDEIMYFDDD